MDNYIEKLHETLLEILLYVDSVCEKNNLRYCLAFGTALGAHRHKGFIPWDDDVDIYMPRQDFERFEKIVEDEDGLYTVQNEKNEKNYFFAFSKLRKKNTLFLEDIAKNLYTNNGIYIDIFILDNMDNPGTLSNKIKIKTAKYLYHCLRMRNFPDLYKNNYGKKRYLVNRIISVPSCILSKKRTLAFLKALFLNNNESSEYLAELYDLFRRETLFPPKKIMFEGHELYAPNDIEKYLENMYGSDYMELPPEEERTQTHAPIKIEF